MQTEISASETSPVVGPAPTANRRVFEFLCSQDEALRLEALEHLTSITILKTRNLRGLLNDGVTVEYTGRELSRDIRHRYARATPEQAARSSHRDAVQEALLAIMEKYRRTWNCEEIKKLFAAGRLGVVPTEAHSLLINRIRKERTLKRTAPPTVSLDDTTPGDDRERKAALQTDPLRALPNLQSSLVLHDVLRREGFWKAKLGDTNFWTLLVVIKFCLRLPAIDRVPVLARAFNIDFPAARKRQRLLYKRLEELGKEELTSGGDDTQKLLRAMKPFRPRSRKIGSYSPRRSEFEPI